jgi:mono/diheme cytochrome c family protein
VVIMKIRNLTHAALGVALALGAAATALAGDAAADTVARGRYLVTIGGCNDCHTAGYPEQGGNVPESEWLKGAPVGFQGPWGTTYAANLRLVAGRLTAEQWIEHARQERLPPMPWFNLRRMTDADLMAMHAYIRALGAPGAAAPAYVAPGGKVTTSYIVFVPQVDAEQAAAQRR